MKKNTLIFILLALSGWAFATPKIDQKQLDILVNYLTKQHDISEQEKTELRNKLSEQIQRNAILAEQTIKLGLDKRADTQALLNNAKNDVYAARYIRYLIDENPISEHELREIYRRQTRLVRLQQVSFETEEEAKNAYSLLKKGLSFDELMQRYPNPEQNHFNEMISPNTLPSELAQLILTMERGQITPQPVHVGKYYFIFKLAQEEPNRNSPSFEQTRNDILQHETQDRVQTKINEILKANGWKASQQNTPDQEK